MNARIEIVSVDTAPIPFMAFVVTCPHGALQDWIRPDTRGLINEHETLTSLIAAHVRRYGCFCAASPQAIEGLAPY